MCELFFSNCRFYICPDGLLQKRIELFEKQVSKYGGTVTTEVNKFLPTHILVEDVLLSNPGRARNALKSIQVLIQNAGCEVIGLKWLCCCLKEKKLISTDGFLFHDTISTDSCWEKNDCDIPIKKPRSESSLLLTKVAQNDASDVDGCTNNKIVIEEFQKLADAFRNRGDRWRSVAYDRAVSSLKTLNTEITDVKELKSLPHISAKMLDKISEILENGFSSKVESICKDERTQVLELFSGIHGVGPVTAQMWYQKGLRTLEDVELSGILTCPQKIGFKYYKEIQEPIPRQEVEEIMQVVKAVAVQLEPSVQFVPCGSYRRGKQLCGDVDILLIINDSINYRSLIPKLIRELKKDEFIIDDLVNTLSLQSSKYLGLCKLNGKNKVRRLDLFAVPEKYAACALMQYTGSALFNRGIRTYASKMNMQLTESVLKMKGSDGKILTTPQEESIFEHLGLQYRPPTERQLF